MVAMSTWARLTVVGTIVLVAAGALTSCSNAPTAGDKAAVQGILTTTSTTSTTTTAPTTSTTSSTSTTLPGVTVPNVIGLKIAAARAALHAVGLPTVGLNHPCNKGTLASQSVVSSLSIPGKPPDPRVGAVPLVPGTTVPPRTRVGITWSDCYGNGSTVPDVVGLTFAAARHALHAVGLAWACYSAGTTTTTTASSTTTSAAGPGVTPTTKPPQTVLSQDPSPGGVLKPGTPVAITMHRCPR